MNDFKECINTANYIVKKITEKTGYKVALNKIKESTDPDDFYILYRMTINGQNYKLYAGDEDFTIAGEDNEIYIESDGFNTNRNIEYFCERIDGVNESMDFGEAKQILKENGFMLEGSMSLEDKIHNAKAFNIIDKLPKPTKDDLYGYRRLCTSFASLKNLIVKKLKNDFDEETIEAILKAYGDRIYFNVMKSQLPSDELATTIVGGLLDLLDELN